MGKLSWFATNKLYLYTPISGFSFIPATNKKSEIIIWYLTIAVFLILTFINLVKLTDQYTSGQTVTSVTVGKEFDLPYAPPIFVNIRSRFPFANSEFYPETNVSIVQSLRHELDSIFADLDTGWKLLNKPWPYALLLSFINYHYFIISVEKYGNIKLPLKQWPINEEQATNLWNSEPRVMAGIYAYNHSATVGVSSDDLLLKLNEELIDFVGLEVKTGWYCPDFSNSTSFPRRDTKHVTTLHATGSGTHSSSFIFGIWPIHPPDEPCKLPLRRDYINVSTDLSKREKLFSTAYNFSLDQFVELVDQSEFISRLNVLIPTHAGSTAAGVTAVFGGEPTSHDLRASSLFRSIYRKETPCSAEPTTKLTHAYRCIRKDIEEKCHCHPYWYKEHHERTKYTNHCTLEKYYKCRKKLHFQYAAWENCRQSCLEPCDRVGFWFKPLPIGLGGNMGRELGQHQARIYFYNLTDTEFPVFTEEPAQSFQSFLAECGGTLDFYLGITVIGILHMIIYGIKQILYSFDTKTKTGKRLRRNIKNGEETNKSLPFDANTSEEIELSMEGEPSRLQLLEQRLNAVEQNQELEQRIRAIEKNQEYIQKSIEKLLLLSNQKQ